ncbi:hypothetical protein XMM379_003081 [Aliiroseovarius sp. xm-m-379]|uniref:hypothetical protein n=1 Tax=unclassified Aliiroseovarius TaxID=2623558 RepID=UPI0015692831|nr:MULTISPECIES: hypothetical protein [unclassified Aliiroseovarius]NRP11484.1 hypothetical protein [Aliiroseovarius sp. xm-d-517]NRP26365.1 hypothetical protein [Aliiroseovarius sp. xm-m-379]NRP32064.1 hypothetical protein [Aliiroseovarius sp. xm-m-314]NRP35157.1 hypothetical protein [Aliiroseovarius sp. xm-a-104]NRP42725.1 hypothetical protein [Aliiroseovarius sp. xm-m-339-2]
MKNIIPVVLCALVFGKAALAQVTNLEAPGNLKATSPVGCIPLAQAGPDLSPADLQPGVWDCFQKKNYVAAAELTLLMYARGVFDTHRVLDKTAHQAIPVLMMGVVQQDPEGWEEHMAPVLTAYTGQGATGAKFCASLQSMPVPTHSASYMVQHGIEAFTGGNESGLAKDFDPAQAWSEVLHNYMKCD